MGFYIATHGESATYKSLIEVMRSLRWTDLDRLANNLEVFRKAGTMGKSSRPLTGSSINEYLQDDSSNV